ncbi:transposase, partial [Neisseria meningitidis]|uniref:transposase n=1 Tax=Neisseria meningitidis TaxID=487 RepID=UPI001622EF4B
GEATPYWFKFNPLYVVEQSFGTLHRKFRYAQAAYFGLIKVSAQSHLKAMCLNLLK